jgi:hypothetical protein
MSLNCRVFRDEKGQIDFVNAPNGNRSKLFDTLVNITGGNKNTALNIYALTEVEEFKDAAKAKMNSFKERFKNVVKVAPSYSNMNSPVEEVRFSKTSNTSGYFSNALSAVSNLSDKNPKNTQGWIKQLTDVQKNGGVKNVNQELQWIGLEDYLNDYVKENSPKAGNIPASVVEDYIKSNQIEIVDVSKGGFAERDRIAAIRNQAQREGNYDLVDYYDEEVSPNLISRGNQPTKYEGYQLKGGENYREVLLTMPNKEGKNPLHIKRDQLSKQYREAFDSGNYDLANEIDNQISEITKQLQVENSINTTGEKSQYKSSHWDEANILAHVRLNEKTLPDGRRVLIVNEMQSDWAQDGRKKGFVENRLRISREQYEVEEKAIEQEALKILGTTVPNIFELERVGTQEAIDLVRRVEENTRQFLYLEGVSEKDMQKDKVAQMPYKNTDQWVGLATRRVLQMAAQEGYDGVAFATGEQSANMYSLAKQVDNISWDTEDNTLTAKNEKGIIQFQESGVTEDQLEKYVGKEVAQKLIDKRETLKEEDEGVVNLDNAQLEIGGEGMKAFYNQIVPKVAQKEAQRFDKNAKLDSIDFGFSARQDVSVTTLEDGYTLTLNGDFVEYVDKDTLRNANLTADKNGAEQYFSKYLPQVVGADKLALAEQPFIAITDKMRSELQEAIPLFSKTQGQEAPREILDQITDRLKQSGLASNVYQMSNSEIETKLAEIGKGNVDMTAAGFTYQGNVYLNSEVMGLDTPIHEFGHLHLDWLKENRTDLYKAGLSLIDKNKEEAQQYINTVKQTQPNLVEGTEKFNNEVLAQVIGDQGARLVNSSKENTLADWLKNVWESIKNFIGLTDYTAEQVANMTLAEFGTASAVEILSGSRIQRTMGENNVYLRYKYDVNQVARERFDIPNLKEISSGSDRVVFDLGDGKVLKVANTARGLAQNMQEGDAELISKGLIPQVYETGLNYVVAEKVEAVDEEIRIPIYNLKGEEYGTEALGTMIEELNQYSQADFDVKDQDLLDILKTYGLESMADYDILYGDLTNVQNWGVKDGKLIHLDAGTFGGMYMIRAYARRKDLSFEDFKQVYEKSQEAKAKFGDMDRNVNFSIVAGNKLFNEPLEEAATIADEYIAEKGLSTAPIQKITKLNTENSKKIAEEFDKMKPTPNDPQTKLAYNAMVKETLEQYEKILSKGYKVEINNSEPYDSSADMIKDLRDNKRMKIFSTESGFGDEAITDKQRKENPLLQETKYKDANGLPLLANDVFRFVHDFFGHAKFGNGFGAIGEENAWNIHARMYSPLARRAMTTETRGQNSWVNFSGVNAEAFKKRDRARMLRQEGKIEEAKRLTEEVYNEMSFAEQKIGLLPEWASIPSSENISPENSSNYANLTEDGQGNFVFYHVGKSGYETIKRSSGGTLATSKQEAQALSKVGGLAMFYTRPEDSESMVTGESKYIVKVPINKVYDFNTDNLNLIEKAKELHSKEHPGKTFDPNTQVAYITKVAGELGYEMVVAQWGNRTRAQSINELKPMDTQITEGNTIKQAFQENYDSNSTKGYKSVIPQTKDEQLNQFYLELNAYRSRENRYDGIYNLYVDYYKFSPEEISEKIKKSDIPQEYKNKYDEIISSPEGKRMSTYPVSKSVKREPSLELNGTRIFAKERVNPITGENMGDIEWELIESTERGKGNARKAAELFLNGTDAQGKDVYLTISPRDNETSPEKLEDFYSSLGFKKISDFEMTRKAKPITPKDVDSNGEVSVQALMDFSNSKVKPLGLEGLKAAKNAAMALKVKSSKELIEKMEKALMKNGIVLFDKLSLQRSKLYNVFEINTILASPRLQKQIKESILALKNSEPFTIEFDDNFIVPQGREVNQFGKQEIINPNIVEKELLESVAGLEESEIDEALPEAFSNKYYTDADFRNTVDTIAREYKKAPVKVIQNGELVDKIEDVEGMLRNSLTDDANDAISDDIMFLREEIDEEVFNSNLTKVSKLLNKIKKNAYINGIDLRNLPTVALEMSREELLGFLDSMEDAISDLNEEDSLQEFSERYSKILGDNEQKIEVIKSESKNDIFVEDPLSEYEMFSRFGLIKKDNNIFRQVSEESLDTLYENFFEYKNLLPEGIETVEDLKSYVQKNSNLLEVSDYEVDVDNLEKMFLYKKFFDFSMSTQSERVPVENFNKVTNSEEYLKGDFIKEFNKWILATNNPYFKVTGKGIELVNKDEVSKEEAVNSVPERFKQELSEYNVISKNLNLDLPLPEQRYEDINTQLEQRQKVVNNPNIVPKITGQYAYLKDGVLAVKNEGNTFVRTPIGVFEKIFEFENIKFYGKLDTNVEPGYKKVNAEAPFSDINFKEYTYLSTTPDSFKESKNYYSRKELNDINDEYFACQ